MKRVPRLQPNLEVGTEFWQKFGLLSQLISRGNQLKSQISKFGYMGTLSKEIVDFAHRQFVNQTLYKGDEHRRKERFPMMVPVIGVELDDFDVPLSEPFEMITRDVAANSIGLIHDHPIYSKRLAIHLSIAGIKLNFIISIKWCDSMGPFYGSGGTYLKRFDKSPYDLGLDLDSQAADDPTD